MKQKTIEKIMVVYNELVNTNSDISSRLLADKANTSLRNAQEFLRTELNKNIYSNMNNNHNRNNITILPEYTKLALKELNENSIIKYRTYIMQDISKLFKIGRSTNIENRLSSFITGNPTIHLIAVSNEDIETELHQKLFSKRIKGEWFKLTESDILDLIQNHNFKMVDFMYNVN